MSGPDVVHAGTLARFTLTLSGPPQSCKPQFVYANSVVRTLQPFTARRALLTWSWRVPRGARTARWTVRVACDQLSAQAALRVEGQRNGRLTLGGRGATVSNTGPLLTQPATESGSTSRGSGTTRTTGGSGGSGGSGPTGPTGPTGSSGTTGGSTHTIGSSSFDTVFTCTIAGTPTAGPGCNGFGALTTYGSSTYYAYTRRPDIVNRGTRFLAWDAKYWATNARAEGYPVDSRPQAGDILVWPGAGASGQVSYVDSVSSDGSITIIDNGAEGQGYGQPAVLTAAELQFDLLANQQFRPDEVSSQAGTWFIHQHP